MPILAVGSYLLSGRVKIFLISESAFLSSSSSSSSSSSFSLSVSLSLSFCAKMFAWSALFWRLALVSSLPKEEFSTPAAPKHRPFFLWLPPFFLPFFCSEIKFMLLPFFIYFLKVKFNLIFSVQVIRVFSEIQLSWENLCFQQFTFWEKLS